MLKVFSRSKVKTKDLLIVNVSNKRIRGKNVIDYCNLKRKSSKPLDNLLTNLKSTRVNSALIISELKVSSLREALLISRALSDSLGIQNVVLVSVEKSKLVELPNILEECNFGERDSIGLSIVDVSELIKVICLLPRELINKAFRNGLFTLDYHEIVKNESNEIKKTLLSLKVLSPPIVNELKDVKVYILCTEEVLKKISGLKGILSNQILRKFNERINVHIELVKAKSSNNFVLMICKNQVM